MSVLIKGMELPNICAGAVLTIYEGSDGIATAKVYNLSATDLIEIPPHGRLIDADKLLEHFPEEQAVINGHIRMGYAVGVGNVQDIINAAPTIIEAEEEK